MTHKTKMMMAGLSFLLLGCEGATSHIAYDKQIHLSAGIIGHVGQEIVLEHALGIENPRTNPLQRCWGSIAAAIGKEMFDLAFGMGKPEILDAVATIAGCLVYDGVSQTISGKPWIGPQK